MVFIQRILGFAPVGKGTRTVANVGEGNSLAASLKDLEKGKTCKKNVVYNMILILQTVFLFIWDLQYLHQQFILGIPLRFSAPKAGNQIYFPSPNMALQPVWTRYNGQVSENRH